VAGKSRSAVRKKSVPMPFGLLQVSHQLAWN